MFTRPFGYKRAAGFADACALLRAHGEAAKVIAGGQSLLPMVNLGLVQPGVLVDVSRIGQGREVSAADGYLTVGTLVTHARLESDPLVISRQPLLATAAACIGNIRVRNRGTLGGSLAHSDPAAELPIVMVALGAAYQVTDGRATRTVRAEDFHLTFLTNALADDELLTAATLPALGPGWGWSFQEVSRRKGDFALAAVAALVRVAAGIIVESRVAAGGVADRPIRLAHVEAALSGAAPQELAGRIEPLRGLSPVSDTNGSAEHRAHVCAVLVRRALDEACRRSLEAAA